MSTLSDLKIDSSRALKTADDPLAPLAPSRSIILLDWHLQPCFTYPLLYHDWWCFSVLFHRYGIEQISILPTSVSIYAQRYFSLRCLRASCCFVTHSLYHLRYRRCNGLLTGPPFYFSFLNTYTTNKAYIVRRCRLHLHWLVGLENKDSVRCGAFEAFSLTTLLDGQCIYWRLKPSCIQLALFLRLVELDFDVGGVFIFGCICTCICTALTFVSSLSIMGRRLHLDALLWRGELGHRKRRSRL